MGYAYGPVGFYFDYTYLLVIIGLVLCLGASALVKLFMSKYHKVPNARGMTGAEAARRILDSEGLQHVRVECLASGAGDHYDPFSNAVRLSRENYMTASVTSISVAAHECGHAIQHAKHYLPLTMRTTLVPVANLGNTLAIPLIFIGVLLSFNQTLITIGIWAFALAVLFQFVTLPVEFNASRRGVQKMEQYGLLGMDELSGAKKVLFAAALTYVAAAASSALQLLRLILLYGGRSGGGSSRRR